MCHERRRGGCKKDRQRSKTGIAYFLSTRIPHANPERPPPAFYHRNFFARAAAASLHTPPPPPQQQTPHSLSHPTRQSHETLPILRTSVLSLPCPLPSPCAFLHGLCPPRPPSASDCALEAGFPILLPLVTLLKSSAALNVITMISRVALTLLPLSVRAKIIYVIRERYLQNPNANGWMRRMVERGGTVTANGASMRLNARVILPFLVSLPFLLLGGIIAASYERTPLTGRRRIILVSPAEEADLVQDILERGAPMNHAGSHDWVTILRNVLDLGDEGVSPTTGRRILLGGEVLDERDWRVRWTDAVLRGLERGVPSLATNSSPTNEGILPPPPTKYPLRPRPAHFAPVSRSAEQPFGAAVDAPLVADYDLLVIDRQEANAFSFGFGPEAADGEGSRGVIVVYSGFLDQILGYSTPSIPAATASPGIFSNILPSRKPGPIDLTTTPSVLPSSDQTKSLAVLLSHELAHLVLSHTLESYASTSLLIPQLSKLGSDVLRTIIYPFTAMLGPFLNDSIGASLTVGAAGGFGVLGRAVNSCSSRQLEGEADVVALRLLAHAGIDPHFSLDFWEDRLASPPPSTEEPPAPTSHLLHLHTAAASPAPSSSDRGSDDVCGFLSTHPVNASRVQALRDELRRWELAARNSTLV